MIEAAVNRWQRYGKDRLYVTARDGVRLGWHDLQSGATHCHRADRVDELDRAIAMWRERNGISRPEAPRPRPDTITARSSADPVDVDLAGRPAGRGLRAKVAEYDSAIEAARAPERQLLEVERDLREQDRRIRVDGPVKHLLLAMVGRRTPERRDLQQRIKAIRAELRLRRAVADGQVWGLWAEREPWATGLDGELLVGRVLDGLVADDPRWRVLHGVPVGTLGSDIDHVLIGPTGVYTLNTKHHRDANVFVAHDAFLVNGVRQPYVRNSRHEAQRAARLLSARYGRRVEVTAMIVVVRAGRLTIKAQPRDVVVAPRGQLRRVLASGPVTLRLAEIEQIFDVARRSTTWSPMSDPTASAPHG